MKFSNKTIGIIAIGFLCVLALGAAASTYMGEEADFYTPPEETAKTSADATAADTSPSKGMPGCVCHSKNPAMVRMHDSLNDNNCGNCHKAGDNLMDPNRSSTGAAELDARRNSEAVCKECHADGKVTVKPTGEKKKTKISNALFCPKCRKQITSEDKTCGDCNGTVSSSNGEYACSACGPLVDINKVAALSKEKPSNDICRLCHYDAEGLATMHKGFEGFSKAVEKTSGGIDNCLACHKSHNQCGGCHF